jgi:hypothetical protein
MVVACVVYTGPGGHDIHALLRKMSVKWEVVEVSRGGACDLCWLKGCRRPGLKSKFPNQNKRLLKLKGKGNQKEAWKGLQGSSLVLAKNEKIMHSWGVLSLESWRDKKESVQKTWGINERPEKRNGYKVPIYKLDFLYPKNDYN